MYLHCGISFWKLATSSSQSLHKSVWHQYMEQKKLCKKKSRKIADQWKSVYVMPQTEICIISILSWPPSARVLLSGLLLCSCVFPGSVSGRRVAPQLRPGWGAGESWRAGIERCQWTSETGTAPALLYFSWCTVALWPFLAPGGSGIVRWKWLQ